MLPAVESSVIDSKIKDVKIYSVVDQPCEDLKLKNLG
jgi:hypothetical protein